MDIWNFSKSHQSRMLSSTIFVHTTWIKTKRKGTRATRKSGSKTMV